MDLCQILLAIAGLLALFLLHKQQIRSSPAGANSGGKSPPEPPGAWPIIGHLHKLFGPDPPQRCFAEFADKYGPVFTLKLGMQKAVVVSNWEAVKECFTTNDKAFASRPPSSAGIYLGYNFAAFGIAPYGLYWRDVRKLDLLEVLSSRRLEMLKQIRVSEIETSIKQLYSNITRSEGSSPAKVVISERFDQLTLNIIVRTIAGRRYTDSKDGSKNDAQDFKSSPGIYVYFGTICCIRCHSNSIIKMA